MLRRLNQLALTSVVLLAAIGGARASEPRAAFDPGCTVARELRSFAGDLPQARAAIADGQRLTVVSLGSSSTMAPVHRRTSAPIRR